MLKNQEYYLKDSISINKKADLLLLKQITDPYDGDIFSESDDEEITGKLKEHFAQDEDNGK